MDSFGCLIANLKNSAMGFKNYSKVANSKFNRTVLDIFRANGFIYGYKICEDGYFIIVNLRYILNKAHIFTRMSRIYVSSSKKQFDAKTIMKIYGNAEGLLISSSKFGIFYYRSNEYLKTGGAVLIRFGA